MHIAFFADNFYPEISGISDSILITGRELTKRGHAVVYVAPYYSKANYEIAFRRDPTCPTDFSEQECINGMPVIRLPSLPLPLSPTKQSRIAFPTGKSFGFFDGWKPDIVHTNSPYGCGWEALRVAKRYRIPLIGTNHTPVEEFYPWAPHIARRLDAMYYNNCQFVSAPYTRLLEDMREKGFKRSGAGVQNPVELPLFMAPTPEEKAEIKKGLKLQCPTILYAGRLAREKHVDVIIKAISKLLPEFPLLTFVATGHGLENERLKALTSKLGLADNVRFTGFIPAEKLAVYYQAADIFAIMSTADSQSLSLMQAYATGLPVVAARSRGFLDYVPPECGFLVEPENIEELAGRLRQLLNDASLAKRMGDAGISYVKQFSPEIIAERWENIYAEVIRRHEDVRTKM